MPKAAQPPFVIHVLFKGGLIRRPTPLLPSASGLRPLKEMVDRAEAVGDAGLAPVANQEQVDLAELLAAV